MSGGISRPMAPWYVCAWLTLALLSGCSLFSRPAPVPVIPAPSLNITTEEGPLDTGEQAASAPVAASVPEAPEPKPRVIKKPRHIFSRRKAPEPPAPPPPPPAPPPLITTEAVPRETVQGLLDSRVQKPDGKSIGRAVDILVDAKGKAQQMVVNLTGFLGVGDRKLNFPWSGFRFAPALKKKPITLILSPAEMKAAGAAKPGAAAPPLLPLLDGTVQRKDGSRVGRVVDVLIDAAAQPRALVLDVNDSSIPIGQDVHNIAANWSALNFFAAKDHSLHVQMDLSKAQIKAAPPYASGKPILLVSPAAPPAAATPAPAAGASAAAPASSTRSPR